jgi:hypothetical protein
MAQLNPDAMLDELARLTDVLRPARKRAESA